MPRVARAGRSARARGRPTASSRCGATAPRPLAERQEGVAQLESQVDGRLEMATVLRQVHQRLERALAVDHRIAVGTAAGGAGPCLAQVRHRLVPDLAAEGVMGEWLDLF